MSDPPRDQRLGSARIDRIVFDEETVRGRVAQLAAEITEAYTADDRLLVLGLLKGSFLFVADLVREIRLPLQIDFLIVSSYGSAKKSSGDVRLLYDASVSFEGRAVLIVEDIVDSGRTLDRLMPRLRARGPKSLDVCALLHKRVADTALEPRWVGFDAPKEFLVGYGLDYAEDFRHLPYIASL